MGRRAGGKGWPAFRYKLLGNRTNFGSNGLGVRGTRGCGPRHRRLAAAPMLRHQLLN